MGIRIDKTKNLYDPSLIIATASKYECKQAGCQSQQERRGLCEMHYIKNYGLSVGAAKRTPQLLLEGKKKMAVKKLTEEEVFEIRVKLKSPMLTQRKIAKQYGVAASTIAHISTGRIWGDLQCSDK